MAKYTVVISDALLLLTWVLCSLPAFSSVLPQSATGTACVLSTPPSPILPYHHEHGLLSDRHGVLNNGRPSPGGVFPLGALSPHRQGPRPLRPGQNP